ncbi:protein G12 [Ptiloglossa arizonensis]|uniref:protein G12 n=1 Tax=Ptiloglossa arizonensis TaxID=3350558 RepID=UPI003F9FB3E7
MNPQIVFVSAVATASVALVGFLAYRVARRTHNPDFADQSPLKDNSSLEEDLKDILAFVPPDEVQEIFDRYMKYDTQIGDTVRFINDQKRFLVREAQNIPEMKHVIDCLRQMGLNVDQWQNKIHTFWKTSARFVRYDSNLAMGGLTMMIDDILQTIPLDELDELLRQKYKYSRSFRRFLQLLTSKDFGNLCIALEENNVFHHHYFWAKESGLEITFAIELLKDLYGYLTQSLVT